MNIFVPVPVDANGFVIRYIGGCGNEQVKCTFFIIIGSTFGTAIHNHGAIYMRKNYETWSQKTYFLPLYAWVVYKVVGLVEAQNKSLSLSLRWFGLSVLLRCGQQKK